MTPVQIAYFKHFLFDKGIQSLYIKYYRTARIKEAEGEYPPNPESIEQFLQQTPPWRVLTKAFYFKPGSDYGYDYWMDQSRKWKKYWELHEDNFNNDLYINLKGTFAILRQNWDLKKYWEVESLEDTYKRMGMEPPFTEEERKELIVPSKKEATSKIEADYIEDPNDPDLPWNKLQEIEKEPKGILEGFSLVDTSTPYSGRRLATNDVTVNMRNGGYRLTFSTKVSNKLREHTYKYVKFLTNPNTKEIALIFNQLNGHAITIRRSVNEVRNVTINSKEVVEYIHKFYGLKKTDDFFTLEIVATVYQDTNTIFKLKLKE